MKFELDVVAAHSINNLELVTEMNEYHIKGTFPRKLILYFNLKYLLGFVKEYNFLIEWIFWTLFH